MLYAVTTQPNVFIFLAMCGFLCGFLFDVKNIFCHLFKNNKILTQILLFFATISLFFVFFVTNLIKNYGEIRLFSIIAFSLAFAIQRYLMNNFVANWVTKCYNKMKAKHNEKSVEKT
ncbi:MAG: spore cortex biosynthesis protein YabQ [Candidatus Caccovivens sp.]